MILAGSSHRRNPRLDKIFCVTILFFKSCQVSKTFSPIKLELDPYLSNYINFTRGPWENQGLVHKQLHGRFFYLANDQKVGKNTVGGQVFISERPKTPLAWRRS